jgi:acetamidase/formamidase
MSLHHTIACRPEHCHWGFFDAALQPVVRVASGDTVAIDCVSGGRDVLPTDPAFEALADHRAILDALTPRLGAHILTGPVAV